jgi:hypothetical protein
VDISDDFHVLFLPNVKIRDAGQRPEHAGEL